MPSTLLSAYIVSLVDLPSAKDHLRQPWGILTRQVSKLWMRCMHYNYQHEHIIHRIQVARQAEEADYGDMGQMGDMFRQLGNLAAAGHSKLHKIHKCERVDPAASYAPTPTNPRDTVDL